MNQTASKEVQVASILLWPIENHTSKKTCVTVTGMSNFSLKSQILKALPKMKTYRNQETFDEKEFNEDVKSKLDSIGKLDYLLLH